MNKYKHFIILVLIGFISIFGCYTYYSNTFLKAQSVDNSLVVGVSELPPHVETVTVYICGEVKNPDLYTLPLGSRINDAIELAGGLTEYADLNRAESMAEKLKDGQKIYVPNINDDIDKLEYINNNSDTDNKAPRKDHDVLVNINTADIDELTLIPGIGESTAKTIAEYRDKHGGFKALEEIKNVQRIGDKTYENIKNNITID